jgi:4,5-DOPA dioxygenase extradiol
MNSLPPLYLSHGSPMIAVERSPAALFLDRLGPVVEATFGRPRAVLVISPHSATRAPVVLAARRHEAVHDFGGFPDELYRLRYDPPGDPALAADVARRLGAAGISTEVAEHNGIDHGIWTLMRRAWPGAELPVVPLTLVPNWSPAQQWAVGQAIAPLADEGVLIIGSGSTTHNLRRYFGSPRVAAAEVLPDVSSFQDWVDTCVRTGDWESLRNYRSAAPGAALQHPTDEHWLPIYIAAGAGGEGAGRRIHASVDGGMLAMDGYAFGPLAARLEAALH